MFSMEENMPRTDRRFRNITLFRRLMTLRFQKKLVSHLWIRLIYMPKTDLVKTMSLVKEYNLYSIEDPFQEEAFEDFAKLQSEIDPVLLVGDDLTVTNVARLKTAIDARAIKAMIIKPNQIGTLTETLDTMELARKNGIHCIVSHRSGDTMDDAIADIAYAFGTLGLKCGVPRQKERIIKINRLIHISHEA